MEVKFISVLASVGWAALSPAVGVCLSEPRTGPMSSVLPSPFLPILCHGSGKALFILI